MDITILLPILGVTIGIVTVLKLLFILMTEKAFRNKLENLEKRIVCFSKEYRAKHGMKHKYGMIDYVSYQLSKRKITSLNIQLLGSFPDKEKRNKWEKDKQYQIKQLEEKIKKYENETPTSPTLEYRDYRPTSLQGTISPLYVGTMSQYAQQYANAYNSHDMLLQQLRQLQTSTYVESNPYLEVPYTLVLKKKMKIMPRNFDWQNETIIKSLDKKGKEVKRMRRYPRLYTFAVLSALVYLLWDVVLNANNIVTFLANHFLIAHK